MKRLGLASAALLSATLLGASGPTLGPGDDAAFVSARAISGNTISEARISDVSGRALGSVERVFLDEAGTIVALRVLWHAGFADKPVSLVQPIERFSYDPAANLLMADATFASLQSWAEDDRRNRNSGDGVAVSVVGSGILNGAVVNSWNGERLGRVVDVIEAAEGQPGSLIIASQSGWPVQRVSRRAVPAAGAIWVSADRAVSLPAQADT